MMTKETRKLLSEHKYALQDLHDVLGFDFGKPYGVWMICGKFTVNQIKKMASAAGYDSLNSIIALCVCDKGISWRNDRSYLVTIKNSGVNIGYRVKYHGNLAAGLDNYYRKLDFEDARKNEKTVTYVFAQLTENLHESKTKVVDYKQRWNVVAAKERYYQNGGKLVMWHILPLPLFI